MKGFQKLRKAHAAGHGGIPPALLKGALEPLHIGLHLKSVGIRQSTSRMESWHHSVPVGGQIPLVLTPACSG